MWGISPSRQAPRKWLSAATPRRTPLRPPIWPSSRISSSSRFKLGEALLVGRRGEDAGVVLGMHRRRHRGECVDALDAELPREFDQTMAERVSSLGRLGLADEYDDVMISAGVFPDEESATGQAAGPDQAVLDFNVLDVE